MIIRLLILLHDQPIDFIEPVINSHQSNIIDTTLKPMKNFVYILLCPGKNLVQILDHQGHENPHC